jgi:hypothetical protein
MLKLDCGYVRGELSAYHDEELAIPDQIAIAQHLTDCPSCAVEADDLRAMREAFRAAGQRIQKLTALPLEGFQAEIVERFRVEDHRSLATRARGLLEDPIHVLATGAAVVAGAICVLLMAAFGQMLIDQPASFAALLNARTQDVEILPPSPLIFPRVDPEAVMPAAIMNQGDEEESMSAFSAVITPDGSLVDLELLSQESWRLAPAGDVMSSQADLLAAAATARFQPARLDGTPVAVNVVWVRPSPWRCCSSRRRLEESTLPPSCSPAAARSSPYVNRKCRPVDMRCASAGRRASIPLSESRRARRSPQKPTPRSHPRI